MNDQFVEKLKKDLVRGNFFVKGYSDEEIKTISEKYNINIRGQLMDFLLEMGRCDGGLIGEGYIHLYKPHWGISDHLSFQENFVKKIKNLGLEEYAAYKPFVFAWWEERFYYFLRTGVDDDHVYQYDDDEKDVVKIGEDMLDFLRYVIEDNKGVRHPSYEGDLLSDVPV